MVTAIFRQEQKLHISLILFQSMGKHITLNKMNFTI